MGPEKPLPTDNSFSSSEEYVESLVHLLTTNKLLHTLCGGIHILDFLTATPDLYSQILCQEWRDFFDQHPISDILDVLLRENVEPLSSSPEQDGAVGWRNGPSPPLSLVNYIGDVRRHTLYRDPSANQCSRNRAMKPTQKLARPVSVGMNVKKVHEVGLFASYISQLTEDIGAATGREISYLVDFGSGQNYLGRALASQPYGKNVVAVESKHHNIEGARGFDVKAGLASKKKVMRNKKAFRAGAEQIDSATSVDNKIQTPPEPCSNGQSEVQSNMALDASEPKTTVQIAAEAKGTVQYIEHRIQNGDLSNVVNQIIEPSAILDSQPSREDSTAPAICGLDSGFKTAQMSPSSQDPDRTTAKSLMTISLHSCGNLVHHGLRSLVLNPSVTAVALVGCCYNLITERLVPTTYKLPELRPLAHPRLEKTGKACDPDGFPMSERFCAEHAQSEGGFTLNITARMMAVQAPSNWGEQESESFFTKHFYRALLQKILLDRGVIRPPTASSPAFPEKSEPGYCFSPAGHSSNIPVVIGSLQKSRYASFLIYTRAALDKLYRDPNPELANNFRSKTEDLSDEEIESYEVQHRAKRKELAIIWTLMAFSAGIVEAAIVVDRWLWLKEQREVETAWVEPVFDYRLSPRNLVVVGVKKK